MLRQKYKSTYKNNYADLKKKIRFTKQISSIYVSNKYLKRNCVKITSIYIYENINIYKKNFIF